jgi:SPP1 family predicted phage head-tail adaptor
MRAGPMRHRITIESPIETQGSDGSIIQTWDVFMTAWASIEPLAGREYFAAEREQADISHRIRMRFAGGITHKMRVSIGSRMFEIESVINIGERNRELILMCREAI